LHNLRYEGTEENHEKPFRIAVSDFPNTKRGVLTTIPQHLVVFDGFVHWIVQKLLEDIPFLCMEK
jgi:hypothetical protein